jgi:hypothetical protein
MAPSIGRNRGKAHWFSTAAFSSFANRSTGSCHSTRLASRNATGRVSTFESASSASASSPQMSSQPVTDDKLVTEDRWNQRRHVSYVGGKPTGRVTYPEFGAPSPKIANQESRDITMN